MWSDRLTHFELPPQWSTMREAALIERETGKEIIHMEKGDYGSPEFTPPQEALQAVADSLSKGYVRYSPGPGLWTLRETIAAEMNGRGRPTQPEEIIVMPGAKFGIAATLLLFLDNGDEVIMPDPGYPPDEFWARYQGATIKHVAFRDPRNVDVEELDALITPRTKLVILNTPQRPNGQIIENTAEIADVLAKHPHVLIVSDEIFSNIVYPPNVHHSLAYNEKLRDRTIVIDTFSKTFVMTGLRIGWVTAPVHLAEKFDILLQNSCTNVSTIIQEAALAALNAPVTFRKRLLENLTRKRDIAYNILAGCNHLQTDNAQGSFYLYPKLPPGFDDRETVNHLLYNGVAVVPGSAFGRAGAGHIRLTFTLEDDILREGVQRLVEVINEMVK
ncbi:MAG: pyridoxal phosphate-dependent aminotransferase [Bacillota bacterium]|nr:pyridoxal phosphate-dependent aminotransferase [Bacillota bacterium]MDW7684877.1 pyridoxal phosphate-dependent aminotransferase [Bacillota bacterium]